MPRPRYCCRRWCCFSNATQLCCLCNRRCRWLRAAELTCDRGALLVTQDSRVVVSSLMKLAGACLACSAPAFGPGLAQLSLACTLLQSLNSRTMSAGGSCLPRFFSLLGWNLLPAHCPLFPQVARPFLHMS